MGLFDVAIKRAFDWANDPRHALRARIAQIDNEQLRLGSADPDRLRQLNEAKRRMQMALERRPPQRRVS